jgi:hypothetical protein
VTLSIARKKAQIKLAAVGRCTSNLGTARLTSPAVRAQGAAAHSPKTDLVDQYRHRQWGQDPRPLAATSARIASSLNNRREDSQHQTRGTNDQLWG